MLPASERRYLLQGLNTPLGHYPDSPLIHQQVEAQARVQPEAPALLFGELRLSYGELNRRANQVAHRLLALGVRPDQRVAICVERGVEMIVGLLGILKAGGAYVPIDPAYPRERIAYTLQDSDPVALLVQAGTQSLVADLRVPLIDLDSRTLAHEAQEDPEVPGLTPAHLAYVIYTSGSTGLPKGGDGGAPQRGPAVQRHPRLVRLQLAGRVGAVPFLRLRFLGVGDLGGAGAWRPVAGGAPGRQPFAG